MEFNKFENNDINTDLSSVIRIEEDLNFGIKQEVSEDLFINNIDNTKSLLTTEESEPVKNDAVDKYEIVNFIDIDENAILHFVRSLDAHSLKYKYKRRFLIWQNDLRG